MSQSLRCLLFVLVVAVPIRAHAITCLTTAYSSSQITTLKTNFDALAADCSTSSINTDWANIRTVAVSKSDANLASFLKNYFKGCYHNNVPRTLTGPLEKAFRSKPFKNVDDELERRLQRALVSAMSDKLVDEINAAGGVLSLGTLIEGTSSSAPANCTKRYEIVRLLNVLKAVTQDGQKIKNTFGDELYSRFKTLIADQHPALLMIGLTPDPQTYPWLGVFQGAVWRAMRMVKNYAPDDGGDAFASQTVRTQFAEDIGAWGLYLQTHIDLISQYGLLVTDGTEFTEEDPYVNPAFGGTHELGHEQLQAKAIKRLLDLSPPNVAFAVKSITEKYGLGNICKVNTSTDTCVIASGETDETFDQNLVYAVKAGQWACPEFCVTADELQTGRASMLGGTSPWQYEKRSWTSC